MESPQFYSQRLVKIQANSLIYKAESGWFVRKERNHEAHIKTKYEKLMDANAGFIAHL